jgi:uncharacterized LabA/DUF88 family protein
VGCVPAGFFILRAVILNKTIFFIDGFNLYHAIRANKLLTRFKWIDLTKLCQCFIYNKNDIKGIYYFTALATWSPSKVKKHTTFIRVQEYNGVQIVYGEFRKKTRICSICKKQTNTFEEKETDVNIATHLFELAYKDYYDTAIIISGDSDLIPAITTVQRNFPSKKFGVLIPPGRRAELLKIKADFYKKIKTKHLISCRLPDRIQLENGKIIQCPPSWM